MLNKLTLKNFKKFTNREIVFSPGLNVVIGKNEAGKSTIMQALLAVLYTDATTKSSQFFKMFSNWKNREGSSNIYIEANFSKDTSRYTLVRDYENKEQSLLNHSAGKKIEDPTQIAQAIFSEIKIPTQKIFESTSFVRQSEITAIQFSEDMRVALQRLASFSGADTNLENGLKELEKEASGLALGLKRPVKNPGIIATLTKRVSELEAEYLKKSMELEELNKTKNKGDEAGKSLVEVRQKKANVEKKIENYNSFGTYHKELVSIEEQLGRISEQIASISNLKVKADQLRAAMNAIKPKSSLDMNQASEELTKLSQEIKVVAELREEQMKEAEKLASDASGAYRKRSENSESASIISTTGLVVMISGFALIGLGVLTELLVLSILGIGLVGISVVLVIVAIVRKNARAEDNVVKADPKKDSIQSQLTNLDKRAREVQERQKMILAEFQLTSPEDFFIRKAKLATISEELERTESQIAGRLGNENLEAINQRQNALFKQKAELEQSKLTPEVLAANLSTSEYLNVRRELDMLTIELKRLERDAISSEVRTGDATLTPEMLVKLEEEVAFTRSKLAAVEKKYAALEAVVLGMREVLKKTGGNFSKILASEIEKYLPKLTQGRYSDLRMTSEYDIEVFATEINDWIKPLGQLSLGTVDQIYILARICIARILAGGRLDYLFLDDPFVTFDSQRRDAMKEILLDFAKDTQIFLFTHSESYADWGELIKIDDN